LFYDLVYVVIIAQLAHSLAGHLDFEGVRNFIWFYIHLPLVIGIVSLGAGTVNVIEHLHEAVPNEVRLLFFISLSAVLLSISLIAKGIQQTKDHSKMAKSGKIFMFICFLLSLGGIFIELSPILMLTAAVVLLSIPVVVGFVTWARN